MTNTLAGSAPVTLPAAFRTFVPGTRAADRADDIPEVYRVNWLQHLAQARVTDPRLREQLLRDIAFHMVASLQLRLSRPNAAADARNKARVTRVCSRWGRSEPWLDLWVELAIAAFPRNEAFAGNAYHVAPGLLAQCLAHMGADGLVLRR